MNNRRRLLIVVGVGALATPLSCFAQQPMVKVPRIGLLAEGHAPSGTSENLEAFRKGLRDLGYVEGKNIILESRYGGGNEDRMRDFAADLIRLKVDLIVTDGGGGIQAAKRAAGTVPIIMMHSTDPVATGLVASLARPGGNITGIVTLSPELIGKRLELLKESFPKVSRVAVLTGRIGPNTASWLKQMEATARSLKLQLQILEINTPADFDTAFQAATKGRADALIELPTHIFHEHGKQIVNFAAQKRLPAVFHTRDFVQAGGLMSYGANYPDLYRRVATYVDKILKGAKASELPIEQPTKFDLVINMKTAKALGIKIPNLIMVRADKVIE